MIYLKFAVIISNHVSYRLTSFRTKFEAIGLDRWCTTRGPRAVPGTCYIRSSEQVKNTRSFPWM